MDNSQIINTKKLKYVFEVINKNNFIDQIIDSTYLFSDEPKIFSYSVNLKKPLYLHELNNLQIGGAGVSFFSKKLALIKCLSEVVERISMLYFNEKKMINVNYNDIKQTDILKFNQYSSQLKKRSLFKCVYGNCLGNHKKVLIPAQFIYLGYQIRNENLITRQTTTGAAAGFDQHMVLLRGIYEIIERDALMTTYLNKIKVPLIDLDNIGDKTIKFITNIFKKYKLTWYLFDITNDLEIPTFLSILIDNTKLGHLMTIGYKSRLNKIEAIIGSVEEAFMGRTAERCNFYKKIKPMFPVDLLIMKNNQQLLKKMKLINYLFKQKPKKLSLSFYLPKKPTDEINFIKNLLSKKGMNIYYVDITLEIFKPLGYVVYKVIIPKTQPYLIEDDQELKKDRLKSVAKYFHKRDIYLNKLPHPFL